MDVFRAGHAEGILAQQSVAPHRIVSHKLYKITAAHTTKKDGDDDVELLLKMFRKIRATDGRTSKIFEHTLQATIHEQRTLEYNIR